MDGIWLGIHSKTNEHRVVLLNGGPTIRIRTIYRVPDSTKWSSKEIKEIRVAPSRPNLKDEQQTEPQHVKDTCGINIEGDGSKLKDTPVQEKEFQNREFRITDEVLNECGYTDTCVGCEAKSHGLAHRRHTAECRQRIE